MSVNFLIIELEPTHYKTDLWNAFVDSGRADITVVYTERRNWSPDAGHNYNRFPISRYQSVVLEGRGPLGVLRSSLKVLGRLWAESHDLIYIAGYVHLQTVFAILYASIAGKRFVVHADVFNTQKPIGRFSFFKYLVRQALRRLVFAQAEAVLVCGLRGINSALEAGCPRNKVLNFPYSVSLSRIHADQPEIVPPPCLDDLKAGRTIVFFSGRMIQRKGLSTLLESLSTLASEVGWTLWIEGDGPELMSYVALVDELGLSDRCRFLGFCQYDVHSWLVRSADIIVVPSFEDSWGIVVDEGLQLGKAVVSTYSTGSAVDRIEDGKHGFIIAAGDSEALADRLRLLLRDRPLRDCFGEAAASNPGNIRPEDNVITLMELMKINE